MALSGRKGDIRSLGYSDEELRYIYDKTDGHCNICGKKLSFSNYGLYAEKGAWEVDHSNPVARGGTNYYRNLYPLCITCNRAKADRTTPQVRSKLQPKEEESSIGTIAGTLALAFLGVGLVKLAEYLKKRRDSQWQGSRFS